MSHSHKNRWLIAASALSIHLSIGTIYAKSVITLPIGNLTGWTKPEINLGFSIAIAIMGLVAAFLGKFVQAKGPRFSGLASALFYSLGVAGTGLAVQLGSLPLFYLFYGAFSGIGIGLGYITPVNVLIGWFPDRKGFAAGLAIMGFGFAAMVFGPTMNLLFASVGVSNSFYILALVYASLMVGGALYLEHPPQAPETEAAKAKAAPAPALKALKSPRFYGLWLMFFLNITGGIAIISVASPMAQEIAGMSAEHAALMVGIMGAFNGLGRLIWATASDRIGRVATFGIFFVLQLLLFILLPLATTPVLFSLAVFLIISCYGGGFSSVPPFISDLFGPQAMARLYGIALTAWSAAGLVGPSIASLIRTATGGYSGTMYVFAGLFALALIILVVMALSLPKGKRFQTTP